MSTVQVFENVAGRITGVGVEIVNLHFDFDGVGVVCLNLGELVKQTNKSLQSSDD